MSAIHTPPNDPLAPFSLVRKVVWANGRARVKLFDNLNKAWGRRQSLNGISGSFGGGTQVELDVVV